MIYNLLGTVIEKLFYWPGWAILRLLTLGHYPPARALPHNRFAVALFAAVVIASGLLMALT
ncbi:hypothetical protein [Janthinobacterium sp. SUN206]|uniref:hypothetical protein n=1 Tax=Janthinobacterium sp. SUN206 TaxID=3014787 RepID=UPI00271367EE|nr:hypothetical protein [Janthinobacterium sp. SUN206]MDO8064993.1 hypothetical protein [Janthinobacterium sp. SUN206]